MARLKADPRYASEKQRVEAFVAQKGGSRATYFRLKRTYQGPGNVPQVLLRNRTQERPLLALAA